MKRTAILMMLIACIFTMSACYSLIPRSIKNSFTYCYDCEKTGIENLINIDGYYKGMYIDKRSPTVGGFWKDTSVYYLDTFYYYFMFYDNGIFVDNIRDSYYDALKKKVVEKDVSLHLKDFSENDESTGANLFYGNDWGGYIIYGDTIKVQRMAKAMSLNAGWHLREDWYKVIDRNTILRINAFNLPATEISQPVKRTQYPIVFVPVSSKPKPDKSWILKEKWFWCNEEDWMEYQKQVK